MKKRVVALLALSTLVLGLGACGGNSAKSKTEDTKQRECFGEHCEGSGLFQRSGIDDR